MESRPLAFVRAFGPKKRRLLVAPLLQHVKTYFPRKVTDAALQQHRVSVMQADCGDTLQSLNPGNKTTKGSTSCCGAGASARILVRIPSGPELLSNTFLRLGPLCGRGRGTASPPHASQVPHSNRGAPAEARRCGAGDGLTSGVAQGCPELQLVPPPPGSPRYWVTLRRVSRWQLNASSVSFSLALLTEPTRPRPGRGTRNVSRWYSRAHSGSPGALVALVTPPPPPPSPCARLQRRCCNWSSPSTWARPSTVPGT